MTRALIVDDKQENLDYLQALLSCNGCSVQSAHDGEQALAIAREGAPDIVISDLLMPVMDGFTLLRHWKADARLRHVPFIVYTATYGTPEDERLVRNLGADAFILKPAEPDVFLAHLREVLAKAATVVPARQDNPVADETVLLKVYSETLIRKLEEKTLQLEEANRALQQDIAQRRLIEKALQESRQRLDGIVNSAMDAIVTIDEQQRIVLANPAAEDMFGYTASELAGQTVEMLLPERLRARHSAHITAFGQAAFASRRMGALLPVSGLRRNGEEFPIEASISTDDSTGRLLFTAILRDVTERRQTQDALADSELRFRQMAENIRDVFFLVDAESNRMLYVSPAYEDIWGCSRESLYENTDSWTDAIHPEDRASTWENYRQATLSRSFEFEYRLVRPDASTRWMKSKGFPVHDAAGKVVRIAGVVEDITDRKLAAQKLLESERRFTDMLGNVQLASVMLDRAARITYCNEYLLRLTGWRHEDILGRNWFELFIPSQFEGDENFFGKLLDDRPDAWIRENQILVRDGEPRQMRWHSLVLRSAHGDVVGSASIGEDITERKLADVKIERLNRLYVVLSGINTLIVRAQGREELFREACRIAVEKGNFSIAWIGVVEGARICVPLAAWAGPAGTYRDKVEAIFREVAVADTAVGAIVAETKVVVFNDIATDLRMRARAEALASDIRSMVALPLCIAGQVVALFTLGSRQVGFFDDEELNLLHELAGDISFALDHLQKAEKLDYLAYYDALTGLANRNLFLERVAQHVRSASNNSHRLAVFLVDLERFKNINDSLGQPAGDELLRQVGTWLARNVGDANLLARVGSDHFAVVLPEVAADADVASFIETMMRTLMEQPFRLDHAVFRIAAKAGVASFPTDGDNADALFKHAEAALKRAKAHGDRYLFYTQAMTDSVAGKPSMESQLRQALDNEEFVLHYQPKVNLISGKLAGAEALIRWNDPRTGLVPPFKFIPSLEETGLIHEVGRWAMRKAIEDYLRWRNAGLAAVRIAVNVSPLQLRSRRFIAEVEEAVAIDAHAAAGLELEITESMVMEDIKQVVASLQVIRDLGVTIAIDDFGTGFSSLGYLSKLPIDTLKVDRSFVIDMTAGPQGLSLVSTIINLAHSLRLKVVGEGVETEEQSRLLRLLSCDEMQGYLFSKPVPADIFEAKFLASPTAAA